jgi:hypothetical protein
MKSHRHFDRLIKRAVQATPPSPYGEIKAYNPSMFGKARDWWKTKTQDTPRIDGTMGPNPSTFNQIKNVVTSPPATAVASGGLSALSKAPTLTQVARPWVGKAVGVAGGAINPVVDSTMDAFTAAKQKFAPAAAPQVAAAPTPAQTPDGQDFDFNSLLPFLPMLMSLFGGGQGAQPIRPMSALDRLGQRSPFA